MVFSAILLDRDASGQTAGVVELAEERLPDGNVTVEVEYSTLNYKDALALTGSSPVVRAFPMVPGIDLAGTVTGSTHPDWAKGDRVVLNGWGAGERHWGGLAQRARLDGDWLVPLPDGLTAREAMAVGTAGYTASLCVDALLAHGTRPEQGAVLVTGATGGVGGIAIVLLAEAGFEVAAVTGKADEEDYLRSLGATQVLDRAAFAESGKPLQKERWAAAVDTAGSRILANACAQVRYGGAVAACGLAQGMDFPASVAPFILRGVSLLGIDSVMAPRERRLAAWKRISRDLDVRVLEEIAREIALGEAIAAADRLLAGEVRGRIVVDVNR